MPGVLIKKNQHDDQKENIPFAPLREKKLLHSSCAKTSAYVSFDCLLLLSLAFAAWNRPGAGY
jgi:hypothetical protein